MTQEELIERNTSNAQHSTGPRTTPGKRRSCLNAIRHSLTGKIFIATEEESEAFHAHCQSYHAIMGARNLVEGDLVQEIAEDRWRLKRARAIENSLFAHGHLNHADSMNAGEPQVDAALAEGKAWLDYPSKLSLLTLHENRIRRAIEKNTEELRTLQAIRKEAHDRAQAEAIALYKQAKAEGNEYESKIDFFPGCDHGGFVYSASNIATLIDRQDRLTRAGFDA